MRKQWSSEELNLLKTLSQAFHGKRWKKISKEFQNRGFQRSEYECRNKWVNYLNPEINNREWTTTELRILYQEYDKHKSQWALIQKSLPTRTQIKIRNQFYGAIRNLVRFVIKYFKKVNSQWSLISNKIRPQTLQNLYSGQRQFEFAGNIIKNSIFSMQFKFDRIKFMEIIQKNQQIFKRANQLILETLPSLSEYYQPNSYNKEDNNEYESQMRIMNFNNMKMENNQNKYTHFQPSLNSQPNYSHIVPQYSPINPYQIKFTPTFSSSLPIENYYSFSQQQIPPNLWNFNPY